MATAHEFSVLAQAVGISPVSSFKDRDHGTIAAVGPDADLVNVLGLYTLARKFTSLPLKSYF